MTTSISRTSEVDRSELVGLAEIRAAAERIADHVVRTPMVPVRPVLPGGERPLWVKPENLQRIGAFKIRGALNAVSALDPADRANGIVASSSGNHGQAVAYAAAVHGIRATVVIPEGSVPHKVDAVRALGAEVVLVPPEERDVAMVQYAERTGASLIPPYDHRDVIAGQGTVGLELATDLSDVATVLVQVGGGGLISGVAAAVKALAPHATVIGVEPELAADLVQSRTVGTRVAWSTEQTFRTIADGVRTPSVGALPWAHIQAHVDDVLTVSERQIIDAVGLLARRARLVAEPSGALSTAAALAYADRFPPGPIATIISGGNVEAGLLSGALAADVESGVL